ncbi:hypothetical protein IV203_011718 [Nitzschia inconspicua]|uniref:Uncharacterized protein n=1 Tax=Nitzschia inconspicua TaxID=303405 RepID=A0A9K3PJI9_9STRA|nr:hypothetical protein IV203_011718 [Nitzschia inconspicua]
MKLPRSLSLLVISIAASVLSFCRQWTVISHQSDVVETSSSSFRGRPSHSSKNLTTADERPRVTGFLPQMNLTSNTSPWAYAYLMAGVDTEHPSYLGIFYNILVSSHILRDSNSTADIVVMVQMSANSTDHRLTPREEDILTRAKIRMYYLDIPPKQSFYTMQMEKFRILDMTEYERVYYLDGDVMPFCSMDYMFELSKTAAATTHYNETNTTPTPVLRENIILAWRIEPAHGGAFILAPKKGDYELLQEIIHRQEQQILFRHKFDTTKGWGHVITPPDAWHSTGGREGPNATKWSWHGNFADQGLLYYWTKYFKKEVSIIIGGNVENWSGNKSQVNVGLLKSFGCISSEFTKPFKYASSGFSKMAPYRDFKHFTGRSKPWLVSSGVNMTNTYKFQDIQTAQEYWFYLFRKIQQRYQLQEHSAKLHRIVPTTGFGGYPTIRMVRATARARKFRSQLE